MIVQTSRYYAVKFIHLMTSKLTSASTKPQVAPPAVLVSQRRKPRDLKTHRGWSDIGHVMSVIITDIETYVCRTFLYACHVQRAHSTFVITQYTN